MRYKILLVAGLASTLAIGALAQKQSQTSPNQPNPGMMGQGQGMLGGGLMMGMMGQMTTHHQQMTELMNKLIQNMAAIQNEKDPAALKANLAEHQALLEQMRDQMTQQGGMMHNMSGQIQQSCPMMGNTPPPGDNKPAK
jgi:uncharacterized coiled-coil protein SlyX